jgi:hypothetical protein
VLLIGSQIYIRMRGKGPAKDILDLPAQTPAVPTAAE